MFSHVRALSLLCLVGVVGGLSIAEEPLPTVIHGSIGRGLFHVVEWNRADHGKAQKVYNAKNLERLTTGQLKQLVEAKTEGVDQKSYLKQLLLQRQNLDWEIAKHDRERQGLEASMHELVRRQPVFATARDYYRHEEELRAEAAQLHKLQNLRAATAMGDARARKEFSEFARRLRSSAPHFKIGFFPYSSLRAGDPKLELDGARQLRIDTLVLHKALVVGETLDAASLDHVLGLTSANGQKVFLGLDEDWVDYGLFAFLFIGPRPTPWTSFDGFYVPLDALWRDKELNEEESQSARIGALTGSLATCKVLFDKPIAVGFTTGKRIPDGVLAYYKSLLDWGLVDVVVVPQEVALQQTVIETAFETIAQGVKVWVNIDMSSGRRSAQPDRIVQLLNKLTSAEPWAHELAASDFFHHLSPGRGEAQEELFRDYRHLVVDGLPR